MALDDLMRKLLNDVDTMGKRQHFIVLEDRSLMIADLTYWDANAIGLMLECVQRGIEREGLILTFKSEQDRTFFLLKHG